MTAHAVLDKDDNIQAVSERTNHQALIVGIQRQLKSASIAANVAGAVIVFLFLVFALPPPRGLGHKWELVALNGGLLALTMVIGLPLASAVLTRLWRERLGWAVRGREPTLRDRELTLRFPVTQQLFVAGLWGLDAIFYLAVNMFFSAELALGVGITILLGGLVTVALGYLLCERLLRPIAALALTSGQPERPQLPGVAARTVLSWTLGAGVVLFGLVLAGISALAFGNFTVARLSEVVIVLGTVGLLAGLVLMIGLADSLSDPIEALRTALERVEQGDFHRDVVVDDGSEIGLLQAGFNRMLAGLREREEIRDLFGRQVGEDVVRHALEHGVELGGEAREAAILFVDLEGSTRLAAERNPADVVAVLNRFFALVVEVVHDHDGWVNKFEGDAALCVFGAPLADGACAANALAAGRVLASRLARELSEIRAGIGITAGRVVAGNLGAARRFEYTVIGDPVNQAARLSDLAKSEAGGVLASAAALERGEAEASRWEITREVTLRGRREPTTIAVPCGAADEAPADQPPSRRRDAA
jgi:adenylate cyclase